MTAREVIIGLLGFAVAVCLACMLTSCKTCECVPTVEVHDSIVVRYQRDTIQYYNHDSIYIHAKGDTVWSERWSIRYRDRIVERVDTCFKIDTKEVVRVEKVVPQYYKGVSVAFWILFALVALTITARILVKVYLHK